jgi:hypothetical protein
MKSNSGNHFIGLDHIRALAAFKYRHHVSGRHILVLVFLSVFLVLYSYFDFNGGFNTAPDSIWVYLPFIEGAAYGILIAWHDNFFQHSKSEFSLICFIFMVPIAHLSYRFIEKPFFHFKSNYIKTNPGSCVSDNRA